MHYVFFFQAEDGIRDIGVTGVQTCALPISSRPARASASSAVRTAASTTSANAASSRARASTASTIGSNWAGSTVSTDRKSVVEGKSGELGGCRIIKKKKHNSSISDLFTEGG